MDTPINEKGIADTTMIGWINDWKRDANIIKIIRNATKKALPKLANDSSVSLFSPPYRTLYPGYLSMRSPANFLISLLAFLGSVSVSSRLAVAVISLFPSK